MVALRRTSAPTLRIANVQASKYPLVTFSADPAQEVDRAKHSWANYFLCGYKGVFDYLGARGQAPPGGPGGGLEIMVDGRVPTGSGLSSSSALVCASALAVMASRGLSFPKADVAELACVCERYCGTQSGGMDQAISIMGQRGLAKVVHFNPVRTDDVALPSGGVFVIANSLTVSNKAETAHTRYNLRVVECRLAAAMLALALGATPEAALAIRTLREVEPLLPRAEGSVSDAALAAVNAHLHEGAYTTSELEERLGVTLAFMFADNAASLAVLLHAGRAGFKLRDRAAHVYAEAARVSAFAKACASGAPLATLGALMDASHASCRDQYECSCAELEELVALAKARGALGARLTGAGWGGCAVMLVREADAKAFLADLSRMFFDKRVATGLLAAGDLSSALFATKPGAGAAVLKLKLPQTPKVVPRGSSKVSTASAAPRGDMWVPLLAAAAAFAAIVLAGRR